MSAATAVPPPPPLPWPGPRLLTAADVAALPSSLPTGDVRYELYDGRLAVMAPPGEFHGRHQLRIGAQLLFQGEMRGLGVAGAETGLILSRNPDTLVGPDAVFTVTARLPTRQTPEGYMESIPDLVLEVRSRNETTPEVLAKVGLYLAAGVRVVWVADPAARTVTAHRAGTPPHTFTDADDLTCDDVITGFRMPVAEVFRD